MSIIEAIILGIIQGLTEFLPVSSSGHLELGKAILGIEAKEDVTFSILVHGATVLSTIVVFYKDILELIRGALTFKWNESTQYIAKIAVSAIPVFIVGMFFKDQVVGLFSNNVLLVGLMLLATGTLLAFTYNAKMRDGEITFTRAFLMGCAQAIAVLPGISRSGATIATGIIMGAGKQRAARFSFLMVLTPILGGNLLEILNGSFSSSNANLSPLIIGSIAAFTSGVIACKWMISIVTRGKLIYFAYYCFTVGIAAIASHFIL